MGLERHIGGWTGPDRPVTGQSGLIEALRRVGQPLYVVLEDGAPAYATCGSATLVHESPNRMGDASGEIPLLAYAAPQRPESLGDASFCADHRLRYPYAAGAMANGIASEAVVCAMAKAGMLSFFGSAGLTPERVEQAIDRITGELEDQPFGINLIHSPNEPDLEAAIVDLFLRRGIRLVEASAFLQITLAVVRYRVHGIHRDPAGAVVAPNRIVAKVSREELAAKFFSPPPGKHLAKLVESGEITQDQAEMAREIPVAQDITAEADSGGHTDNRPAISLLPTLLSLCGRMQDEHGYRQNLRVGLAGGISTPHSAAAAFAMGAAYIMTGSINQACVESGTSGIVRQMLAETRQADVAMAPAADMFEMGVKVQVLKRGTMFPMRAAKMYELYRAYDSVDAIPAAEREKLEKTVFHASLNDVWSETRAFFERRDPRQIERAERDPKHLMALVFRSYLGQSSNWANAGTADRKMDFQIWCGPAMGAFNEWAKGTWLEQPGNRHVADVARNILFGACVLKRAGALRGQGIEIPRAALSPPPLEPEILDGHLQAADTLEPAALRSL